jgi:hypothetical protein
MRIAKSGLKLARVTGSAAAAKHLVVLGTIIHLIDVQDAPDCFQEARELIGGSRERELGDGGETEFYGETVELYFSATMGLATSLSAVGESDPRAIEGLIDELFSLCPDSSCRRFTSAMWAQGLFRIKAGDFHGATESLAVAAKRMAEMGRVAVATLVYLDLAFAYLARGNHSEPIEIAAKIAGFLGSANLTNEFCRAASIFVEAAQRAELEPASVRDLKRHLERLGH